MNYITAFREVVQKNPDKTAVVDMEGTRSTTFSELDRLSDKVAGKLHALGCTRGDFIPVLIERRMEFLAAYFGILKAGCAVVPLIFEYPEERIAGIKKHCEAKLTIDILFFSNIETYDSFEDLAGDTEPALLVYTSGSTGEPKGILHAVSSMMHTVNRYKIVHDGVHPLIRVCPAPFSFIAHLMELLPPLICGGCIHIIPDTIRRSPSLLEKYIETHGITCGAISPKLVPLFHPPACMQRIYTGGEYLYEVQITGKYSVYHLYGQSEAGGIVCSKILTESCTRPTLGKPLPGIEILILDEEGNEVPHGTVGEIGIKGAICASYFKLPQETARTYIKTDDGQTLIHTRDMGYIDENGELVYLNRSDWMVKINGHRVETFEVRHALSSFNGIKEAEIKDFSDDQNEKFLVGYFVSEKNLNVDDIRNHLKKSLPPYMVPRFLVRIPAIPKNINGKTDRKSLLLPKFDEHNTADGNAVVPPENAVQKKIFVITAKIIGHEGFGITTNLYNAGLTSIGVAKLINELSEEFSTVVQIKDIEDNNTIECIERFLQTAPRMDEYRTASDYPLTPSQKIIYRLCIERPDNIFYNVPSLLKIGGSLDIENLKNAVVTAVKAHPYLEMQLFVNKYGDVRQKRKTVSFSASDIEVLQVSSIEEIKSQVVQPFTLHASRLFRVKIIQAEHLYLFLDIHHLLMDGSSMNIFLQDIERAYNKEALVPEKYSGFEYALQKEADSFCPEVATAKNYFKNLVGSIDESYLLPQSAEQKQKSYDMRNEVIPLYHAVEEYTRKNNFSPNAFFTSAFGLMLAKHTGTGHSCFFSLYNGRSNSRFSRTVALMAQAFPVVCELYDITVSEYISQFSHQIHDSQMYCEYTDPFAEVSPVAERINSDAMFNYFGSEYNTSTFCGYALEKIPLTKGDTQISFWFILTVDGNDIRINIGWNKSRFTQEFIDTLFSIYKQTVTGFLEKEMLSDVIYP